MVEHPVQWVTASPLWPNATAGTDPAPLRQPVLLRIASDSFMDDLRARLETTPETLADLKARPASFRARPLGEGYDWVAPPTPRLKLYQPVHGHFNLVAASLVCGLPGLPDRAVDRAGQESVGFVLRRLAGDGSELAWVQSPTNGKGWQPLADPSKLAPFEERRPLSPLAFGVPGKRRRLHLGVIPSGSVDTFLIAPTLAPADVAAVEGDPRIGEVDARVFDVLKDLVKSPTPATLGASTPAQAAAFLDREQGTSLFVLLDLADFLARKAPALWAAVLAGRRPAPGQSGQPFYDRLASWDLPGGATWLSAIVDVWAQKATIVIDGSTNPPLAFNLKDTRVGGVSLATSAAPIDDLRASLIAAFGAPSPDTSLRLPVSKLDQGDDILYTIRCVFDRPTCRQTVVSDPTPPFALAGVFDVDAPARPIRIVLPIDTSPAGLRKFPKNVAFVMSEQLRRQVSVATDLKKMIEKDVADGGGFDLGFICSLSIPIITIVAMIILFVFVILLNLVFWWLPFVKICWPIPKPSRTP